MAKDGYETYGLGDTIDPILPEGWSEGDDLFADAVTEREIFEPDEAQSSDPVAEENEPEESLEDLLPTTESDTGDGAAAEEDDDADVSDGMDEPVAPPSRILRMKVNHKEYDVDVNTMTDEELLERLQKADAFDAMKDSQLKEKFRQVYEDQISQGMTEGVARMVASNATGGKTYSLTDDDPTTEEDSIPVAKTSDPEPVKDFRAQVRQLKAIFPDFKSMPTEVMTAYENGADLMSAYSAYRVREAEKASQAVKKENRILKQNAASAAKAPVRGVSGGGATGVKKEDPFLKGFDSDRW